MIAMHMGGEHRQWWIAAMSGLWLAGAVVLPVASAEQIESTADAAPLVAVPPTLAPPITLHLALEEVLARHPGLTAARHLTEAATYRIPQATALDDPMIGAEIEGLRSGDYTDVEYSARQSWPFPGKRRLRGRIAARSADIAAADTAALERDLIAQTTTAYFALYMVERAIEINRHNRALLERAEQSAESAYAAGERAMADVLQAQMALATLSNALIGLQQERTLAIAQLNALLQRSPEAPIVITTPAQLTQLTRTLEELERLMLAARPQLKSADLAIQRSEDELGLARLGFLPDLTTSVAARQYREGSGGIREVDTMLAVNVPIWFWGKQRAQVQEMRAMVAAATAMRERERLEAVVALRDAHSRLQAAQQSAQLYATSLLPQAEQALQIAQAGYEAHRTSFAQLVEAERDWRDLQLAHQRTLVAFETAWADLEFAVGQPLDRIADTVISRAEESTP